MDEKRLAELEAMANAATEGPWEVDREPGGTGRHVRGFCRKPGAHGPAKSPHRFGRSNFDCCGLGWSTDVVTTDSGEYTHNEADLDFIAAARQAVPELVGEVRRLREELEAMEEEHQCCSGFTLVEQRKQRERREREGK